MFSDESESMRARLVVETGCMLILRGNEGVSC